MMMTFLKRRDLFLDQGCMSICVLLLKVSQSSQGLHVVLDVLTNATGKKNKFEKSHILGKKELKLSLFLKAIIVYIETSA